MRKGFFTKAYLQATLAALTRKMHRDAHRCSSAFSSVALYLTGCECIIHVQTNEEESYSHRHVTCALHNRTALLCLSTADLVFVGALFKAPFRTLSENRS